MNKTGPTVLSVIINFFNMQREAKRTLFSVTSKYQRDLRPEDYEVIAVDNGSSERLDEKWVRSFGENFRYIYFETDSKSPCAALNYAVRQAKSPLVTCLIDGARILSPGILKYSILASKLYDHPFIYTIGMHIGKKAQNFLLAEGYSQDREDLLIGTIDWQSCGYKLFNISSPARSCGNGFFSALGESNCFTLRKGDYIELGGFDERFLSAGGGVVNHDFFMRVHADGRFKPIKLLGEATFHQFHGGVATNVLMENHPLAKMVKEYATIKNKPFRQTYVQPEYFGSMPSECFPLIAQLYVDSGHGFSEQESIIRAISADTAELSFNLDGADPRRLRFDPADTCVSTEIQGFTLIGPDSSRHEITEFSSNGVMYEEKALFDTNDPQIFVNIPHGITVGECRVNIRYSSFGEEARAEYTRAILEQANEKLASFMRSSAHMVCARDALRKVFSASPRKAMSCYRTALSIMRSGLFDYSYYLSQNPDLAASKLHPLLHFLEYGASEGRDPHPLFSIAFYLENNSDIEQLGMNPLVHFLEIGAPKHRDPHPLFCTSFYIKMNPDVNWSSRNPLLHYLKEGASRGRDPHPLFSTSFYLEMNPDVRKLKMNPLSHYLRKGASEGRDPHPLFCTSFYIKANPEVDWSHINPLVHFLRIGAAEQRDPHPQFNTLLYMQKNPDVARTGINPLIHFLRARESS